MWGNKKRARVNAILRKLILLVCQFCISQKYVGSPTHENHPKLFILLTDVQSRNSLKLIFIYRSMTTNIRKLFRRISFLRFLRSGPAAVKLLIFEYRVLSLNFRVSSIAEFWSFKFKVLSFHFRVSSFNFRFLSF